MESLLLRGRVPIQEDALTAALADLLDDLGEPALIECLFTTARAVEYDGKLSLQPVTTLPSFHTFDLELWPSWPLWGEPDLLMTRLANWKGSHNRYVWLDPSWYLPADGEDRSKAVFTALSYASEERTGSHVIVGVAELEGENAGLLQKPLSRDAMAEATRQGAG